MTGSAGKPFSGSVADAEFLDEILVASLVLLLQVIQQAPPRVDHLDQPVPGTVVFLMSLQVPGQFLDSLRQYRYLNVGRSSIVLMELKLLLNRLFIYLAHAPLISSCLLFFFSVCPGGLYRPGWGGVKGIFTEFL
jgi:uncharacterized membrane protein